MSSYDEEYEILSKLFKDVNEESKDEAFKQKLFQSICDDMVKKGMISKQACDMGYKFMAMERLLKSHLLFKK